jgi:hypothetical protein
MWIFILIDCLKNWFEDFLIGLLIELYSWVELHFRWNVVTSKSGLPTCAQTKP